MERTLSFRSVSILSPESANGRNVVALGVTQAFSQHGATTVFRPSAPTDDAFTQILLDTAGAPNSLGSAVAVSPEEFRSHDSNMRADIVSSFHNILDEHQFNNIIIVGTDKSPITDPEEFPLNAKVAADLQSPVFLAVCTLHRNPEQLLATVHACEEAVSKAGSQVLGLFVTGCAPERQENTTSGLKELTYPVWTVPPQEVDPANADSIQSALKKFHESVPADEIIEAASKPWNTPITPLHFQYSLLHQAKTHRKTIVLPEGEEDRIIQAADFLLARDIVDLIIVGDQESILNRAQALGLSHLDKASFQSLQDEALLSEMVEKLCELRSKKGMTPEQARTTLQDASYFGTMLVVLGKADGLVSGSINSTANTVRPALQAIKTRPGSSLVSGAFLMCFDTHVALFADCAINPNPSAQCLAEIAMQSAQTAKSFDIEPRIGMLSYSTLGSGKGPDVDLVEEATALLREQAPELEIVGPIQFDAAWSPQVAASKAKGNPVAGHVNVFVFPDLSAGNIAYKAVQRSSGALAVGPVLQGLNKPVNDLSRGALVQDIINTVALTAAQAD
jgi:phosphate acetyltransferase